MSEVASIRLPEGTVAQLKRLSFRKSLEENKEIRWTTLVRAAIEKILSSNAGEGSEA
jgi:hypothetical protein